MFNSKKKIFLGFAALVLAAGAYLVGAYSMARLAWPIQEIRALKRQLTSQAPLTEGTPIFDKYDRLTSYPGKIEVECPKQTDKTLVLLVSGQSNTGNSAGQRYESNYDTRVINFWNGKCYKAESPLLGTTGFLGESWTLLANKLIAANMADQVVLIPAGIGGTPIICWQNNGDLNKMLLDVVKNVQAQYKVTQVLWHQGESDYGNKTTSAEYTQRFESLVQSLRDKSVDAPIFPAIATKCGLDTAWSADNPVAVAQKVLPNSEKRIYAGPNTDKLLDKLDRYDDCHFSGSGQEKFANAWVDAIKKAK